MRLDLTTKGHGLEISEDSVIINMDGNSAALESELCVGDEILALNGRQCANCTEEKLNEHSGVVLVTIKRAKF